MLFQARAPDHGQILATKIGGADCVERLTTCLREPERAEELRLLGNEKGDGQLVVAN